MTHEGTKAKVITPDGDTVPFTIKTGVLQGDTLAPFIFAIMIEYCMRTALDRHEDELGFLIERRKSKRSQPVVVTDLGYADDIALLSQEIEQAQLLLHKVEVEANKVGLYINTKKTEAVIKNIQPIGLSTLEGGKKLQISRRVDGEY